MKMRLPNLIIPGAAKAGTTSLHHYLAAHPQCGMSQPKETYFFTKSYSSREVERYASKFATVPQSARIIGEATPTYLSNPHAAERIYDTLGEHVRFVFLLRNPIDRATSAFWHVQKRAADRRSISDALLPPTTILDDALRWEQSAIREAQLQGHISVEPYRARHDDPSWNFQYLRNSSYLRDLRRFETVFSRQQMLIVLNEELRIDPIAAFQRIARFLEIDPAVLPANLGQHYNTSNLVKPGLGNRMARFAARRLPSRLPWRKRILESTFQAKPTLDLENRQRLFDLFHVHNQKLGDEYGLNTNELWR